ncbi:MAG: pyridoxal phosphate-dependent aminotransferase [Pigmentiphaga sp.]
MAIQKFPQSKLVAAVPSSPSLATAQRARDIQASGGDLVSLTIGEPDFPTPPEVVEAALTAARRGETRYTPVTGTAALRSAITNKFARENGLEYDPASQILVATGAKQAIYNAFTATLDPSDEVIVFAPYWVSYPSIAQLVGARPVVIATNHEHDFIPRPEDLEAAITSRTRWVVLNFPNNPSGAVASLAQYTALAEVLERHPGIRILSDEIYEHICYDGAAAPSFASVSPQIQARTLVINGVSKAYAMTGWRIGYAAGPRDIIAAMSKLQSHMTGGTSAVSQAAAVAALAMGSSYAAKQVAAYEQRRDLVLARLAASDALRAVKPRGAFYVFVQVLPHRMPATTSVADYLLDYGVAVIDGAAFGYPGWFRISIAVGEAALESGCARILKAFEG